MLPPRQDLAANTADYETLPLVRASGFREYDARWLIGSEINALGFRALGLGLGTLLHMRNVRPHIVVGHDYRSYSMDAKNALITGLLGAGCAVYDVGLAVTPMAYFAQFDLDVSAVAMVTASHNENGWTGVKMGMARPFTFDPEEMAALKDIVLGGSWEKRRGGQFVDAQGVAQRYMDDLSNGPRLSRRLKVVVACGNGTAGVFAPPVLAAIGCDVVPLDCKLDYTFPNYNPNPEDLEMLSAASRSVLQHKADLGLCFDGDGDRCGVIDNEGNAIFADKVGVLLARHFSRTNRNALFIADVKSTGLFESDPVLKSLGARCEYGKTGHSYMKRRTAEKGALAGFEKSGHYFFQPPLGRGYDDGLLTALAILRMIDQVPGKSMADLYRDLPETWGTPTMPAHCGDGVKHEIVKRVTDHFRANPAIKDMITINGVRFHLADGSWGLVRASSNKPELVVVCESPVSRERMMEVVGVIRSHLATYPEVGVLQQVPEP
ncbi:MAG: phosphomannomutase/phosphoglucomutase [Hyphomicrobiales bacterium]|nr:phosphomannomutase/phosphoglucomutase [Hyphomicrobiales bacterium]